MSSAIAISEYPTVFESPVDLEVQASPLPIGNVTFEFVFDFPLAEMFQKAFVSGIADMAVADARMNEPTRLFREIIGENNSGKMCTPSD